MKLSAAIKLLLLLLCIVLRTPASAFAADTIAVVTNTSFMPYEEALTAFKAAYRGKVDVFDLSDDDPEKISKALQKTNHRLITAIGPAALDIAAQVKGASLLTGLVLNPSSHLGNGHQSITGVSMAIPPGESLRVLRQLAPSVKRVGFVYSPKLSSALAEPAAQAAREMGLVPVMRQSDSVGKSIEAYQSLIGQVDAIYLLPDTMTLNDTILHRLLDISIQNKIPLIGFSFKYVKEGALLALSFKPLDIGTQLGEMADRIVSGKRPSMAAFDPPARLKIDINERTAELMNIQIPAALRGSARVYKP